MTTRPDPTRPAPARRRRALVRAAAAAAVVAAVAIVAGRAVADVDRELAPPSHLLGAIDYVPDRATIDLVFGPAPLTQLRQLAIDDSADPGVRIRAIRALAQYPSPEARATLVTVLEDHGAVAAGPRVLYLRAGLEALAQLGAADDVPLITPFLESPVRDVRATAAHALRVIRSPTAVPALRSRQGREDQAQVQWAITEALRAILGGA